VLALLLWQKPSVLLGIAGNLRRGGLSGLYGRVRASLSLYAAGAFYPNSYQLWIRLFDQWTGARRNALLNSPRRPHWPRIAVMLFASAPCSQAAAATRASLRDQWLPVHQLLEDPNARLDDADYVAVLQAGEILAPHALALLADHAAAGRPRVLLADEDRIDAGGHRWDPQFKPRPNHALMLSGSQAGGVWLIRRDALMAAAPGWRSAEAFRLGIYLALWRHDGAPDARTVSAVLTHRRHDVESGEAEELAAVVAGHGTLAGLALQVTPAHPLRIRLAAPKERQDKVGIVIASRCRGSTTQACISAILNRTNYAAFEVLLVLAQPRPPDAEQRAFIAGLADRRVRLLHVPTERFNFAVASNAGVRATDAPLVLLLNDDVSPIRPDWLACMAGHLLDQRVGIVGAKLAYPDGTVQHGGVILGLDGVAEHAGRLLKVDDPGAHGINLLDREVSAVTGACLLTRRTVFDAVGGLDENFASAFNDVDFCLRARVAGWRVVLSCQSPLTHHESLSFGRHYGAEAEAREAADVERMLQRWGPSISNDPFHSPNLARVRAAESNPAFPPRASPLPEDS
jgi:GT2 family glycosyltransferase